jgi:hypothetical protein
MLLGNDGGVFVSRVSSSKSLGDGNATKKHNRLINTYVIPPTQPTLLISRQPGLGGEYGSQIALALVLLHPTPSKVVRVVDKCIALTQNHNNNNNSISKTSPPQILFSGAVAGLVNSCIANDDEDHIAVRRKQKASLMWASRKDKEEAAVELTTEKYFNYHLLSIDCSSTASSPSQQRSSSQYTAMLGEKSVGNVGSDNVKEGVEDTVGAEKRGSTVESKRASSWDINPAATPDENQPNDREDAESPVYIYITDSTINQGSQSEEVTSSLTVDNSAAMQTADQHMSHVAGSPVREQSPSAVHHRPQSFYSLQGLEEEETKIEADEDVKYLLHLAHMTDKKELLDTIINDYMYVLAEEDRLEMKKRELVVEARALLVANPFGDVFPESTGTPTKSAPHGEHVNNDVDGTYTSEDEADFYVHTGECKATAIAAIKMHRKVSTQLEHLHAYGGKLLHYMRLLTKRVIGEAGHGGPLTSPAKYLEQEKKQRNMDQDRSLNLGASSSPPSSPARRRQQQFPAPTSPSTAARTPVSVARSLRGEGGHTSAEYKKKAALSPSEIDARRSSVISDTGSIQYASNLTKEQFVTRYIQRRQRTLNLLFDDEHDEEPPLTFHQPLSPPSTNGGDQNVTSMSSHNTKTNETTRPSSAASSVMFRSSSTAGAVTPDVRTGVFVDDRPGSAQAAARKAVTRPSRTTLLPSPRAGSASLNKRKLPPLAIPSPGVAKSQQHQQPPRSVNSSSTTASTHLKTVRGFYVVKTYPPTSSRNTSASAHDDSILSSGSLRGQTHEQQQPVSPNRCAIHSPPSVEYTTPICASDAPGAVDLWFGRRQLLLKRANALLTKQRRDLANEAVHSVLDFLQCI